MSRPSMHEGPEWRHAKTVLFVRSVHEVMKGARCRCVLGGVIDRWGRNHRAESMCIFMTHPKARAFVRSMSQTSLAQHQGLRIG